MVKETLIIIGILLVLMGAWALVPGSTLGIEPMWHSIAKIAIGLIAMGVALGEKKKA
ncbi:MAG: hypothetical protein MCSN_3560 [Candidatus Microsyncoccus archaeolyticus]|nr:MAG: hypothetical protein MCSN_3560 [Candidatus Parcubacteria bacterium]